MSSDEAVRRWRESAKRNLETAKEMMALNHRDWALFVGQLSLEKLLKGIIAKQSDDAPPYIHNLVRLSDIAHIRLNQTQKDQLATISRFNVEARYDSIKEELYKMATPAYVKEWIGIIEEMYIWIKNQY